MNTQPTEPISEEQARKNIQNVYHAVRGASAIFMLLGVTLFFDLGGAATALDLTGIHQVLGGILLAVGFAEFFIIAGVVKKYLLKQHGLTPD